MKYISTFVIIIASTLLSFAQNETVSVKVLESKLDSAVTSYMTEHHVPGAALIVVKDGKPILKKGYGYTSLGESIREVNPDSTIFRIGSVTKTFTAMAVLQLVDQGRIDLNAPANNYLKTLQIHSPFKKSITPAHLINHSAGFDELPGRRVFDSTQSISLSNFLKERLVPIREPGLISSYSSYGIALAGLLVEEVSGLSLEEYMKQHLWEPLGMDDTTMKLTATMEDNVSWGYEYRNGINVPMPWEYYHTYPASDINSTVADMGKYLLAHLNNGKFNGKQVLSERLSHAMKVPALKVHNALESFAYGFYEEDAHGYRTVSHGGDMLGYASYLSIIPEENLGVFVVHHHEGSRLRYVVMNTILSYYAKETNKEDKFKPIEKQTDLKRFEGKYQWTTFCHTCETGWKPELHELVINDDETFTIFGRTFFQVDSLLFRSTDGERTMGFVENDTGTILYMSTGGINVFEKIN